MVKHKLKLYFMTINRVSDFLFEWIIEKLKMLQRLVMEHPSFPVWYP